jgi:hypothetical protein
VFKAVPRGIRGEWRPRVVETVLLIALVAFGSSLAWHSFWSRETRADQVSDLIGRIRRGRRRKQAGRHFRQSRGYVQASVTWSNW